MDWDLAGKILNVPVYALLGGKFRDKILIYHDTGSPNKPGLGIELNEQICRKHVSAGSGFFE